MSQKPTDNITSVSADLMTDPSSMSRHVIDVGALAVASALLWSYFAPVTEIAAGQGKVIPDIHVQTVQSVEGGYVQAIFAKDGDYVEKDEVILRLDPTQPGSNREEIAQQYAGNIATVARLRALLDGGEPQFSADLVKRYPEIVATAKAQFAADKAELNNGREAIVAQIDQRKSELVEAQSRAKTLQKAVKLTAEELASIRALQLEKAASRAEVLNAEARYNEILGNKQETELAMPRLEAAIVELEQRLGEHGNSFKARKSAEMNEAEIKVAGLKATLSAQDNRVDKTEIKAPWAGVLKSMKATNVGQVIKPFESVAEIVPDSDTLIIQTRIRPEDIGFIQKGMPAIIKLSAYDYSIFGSVRGTLERIAADSTTDERGNVYYAVDVRAAAKHIDRRGEVWPVKPGMVANVEIVTGQKTVFQYLTKPIHRMATMALRER
jgi:membrane fusion protein, adhesin transport system